MSFTNAVINQEIRTENNMRTNAGSGSACLDLFFKAGASRGQDIIPAFAAAYAEDSELAIRIALWARDARGGAGERQVFIDILKYMERVSPLTAKRMLMRTPELGRWKDLLAVEVPHVREFAFNMIENALNSGNALTAKWMPRKGLTAVALTKHMGLTPRQYRKLLVGLTNVVETQMCAGEWDKIDFEKVPSLAAARYRKAFERHVPGRLEKFVEAVEAGEAKVNAGAVFPYDVLKGQIRAGGYDGHFRTSPLSATERQYIINQWNALPNFVGDASILPLIDVSGSMESPVGGSLTALEVAVSLGLYLADKNTGVFNGTFLTFSEAPQLLHLKGDVLAKRDQMVSSKWGMNTDVVRAFARILEVAKQGKVAQADMPKVLLILSDMQFDECARFDDSGLESMRRQFVGAGYEIPQVVFWNIAAKAGVPAKANSQGVALVSGFSPAIVKNLLVDPLAFTPENIMLRTVGITRYDF